MTASGIPAGARRGAAWRGHGRRGKNSRRIILDRVLREINERCTGQDEAKWRMSEIAGRNSARKFAFIPSASASPVGELCALMRVTARGY
ncbi:Uncharacterized protein DBV15_11474 [Temnothorax longispinosus]|uniref:Uncharacterized protein n=1 Tax=Temnothorax longispinosus TaxID=300112 RepID=A0A4V3S9S5_9HYME|nr:Uncharacterized protein DBV15_11474 [Temnothorax longispinosus]